MRRGLKAERWRPVAIFRTKGSDYRRALTRLRLGIGLFVLALAVPSLLLVHKAYDQMKWESFRQQQLIAEELANRIDESLVSMVRTEDTRPVADYRFLVGSGDPANPYTRPSPLSDLSAPRTIPGLVGWFEVAADGSFSSPMVPNPGIAPADYGVDAEELVLRQARAQRIQGILVGNRLVERHAYDREQGLAAAAPSPSPPRPSPRAAGERLPSPERSSAPGMQAKAPAPASPKAPEMHYEHASTNRLSQAAFERLTTKEAQSKSRATDTDAVPSRTEELRLDEGLAQRSKRRQAATPERGPREDRLDDLIIPAPEEPTETQEESSLDAYSARRRPVQLFENAVEPLEVGLLDSGHFLLFRSVWRQGERIIQGALIEQAPFLEALIARPLGMTVLARTTDLTVAYRGALLTSFRAQPEGGYGSRSRALIAGPPPLSGALLYRTRMQEPFGGLELIFSVGRLPMPPGAVVVGWMAAALALVLLTGGWLMYRLGLRQLALVRQQQDFVSAVSHELKTPLTSIRMYAEMLRAGFASEDRKETYYRFIHEESERLSRLIGNVLQLARIGRDALVLEPRRVPLRALIATVGERISSQVERAGFVLELSCELDIDILVDPDAFVQIIINLVDNALKFAAKAQIRRIQIGCRACAEHHVCIGVRDFGPGIPKDQRNRVFDLFYRGDEAVTAAISGTGIGLALVQRLAGAMGGRVDLIDRDPGAEFSIEMPLAELD